MELERKVAAELRERLQRYMDSWGDPFGGRKGKQPTEQDMETLRSLGYVD